METTKNAIPEYNKIFFDKLRNYLDTKIYFFGSVQRDDYFPKSSDIDVDIFTNNVKSTIIQLQNFLRVGPEKFHKFVWKLNYDNSLVNGYKIMYQEPQSNFAVEISIYEEKYKESILKEHNGKKNLPFYATCMLIIIKYLYYTLHILPAEWYRYSKKIILSKMIFKKEDEYIIFKIK